MKSNKNIHRVNIINHEFYADETIFYLKGLHSIKNVLEMLDQFYTSELRPNLRKYEIAGIGLLKNAKLALCGLKI